MCNACEESDDDCEAKCPEEPKEEECLGGFMHQCADGENSVFCDGCTQTDEDCEAKCPADPHPDEPALGNLIWVYC